MPLVRMAAKKRVQQHAKKRPVVLLQPLRYVGCGCFLSHTLPSPRPHGVEVLFPCVLVCYAPSVSRYSTCRSIDEWAVDISSVLSDYVNKFLDSGENGTHAGKGEHGERQDGDDQRGAPSLSDEGAGGSFGEASIVVANAAALYSKKVEFVHGLAVQTLDTLVRSGKYVAWVLAEMRGVEQNLFRVVW